MTAVVVETQISCTVWTELGSSMYFDALLLVPNLASIILKAFGLGDRKRRFPTFSRASVHYGERRRNPCLLHQLCNAVMRHRADI